jgi:tetratricopeptide (TPR) repeat protein
MATSGMEGAGSFREWLRDSDQAVEFEEGRRMAVAPDDLQNQIARAEKELAEKPHQLNRILGLAQLYVDAGELKKAQQFIREKQQEMPDSFELREHACAITMRGYDMAITRLQRNLAAEPEKEDVKARIAELQDRRRAFAVREYTWQLDQHPTDRGTRLKLGLVYFEMGRYNDAIAEFQSAGQDARLEVDAAKMLGLCFLEKGQRDLAAEQFARALDRHPDMDDTGKEISYYQATAYEGMGKTEEALAMYKKIYSTDISYRDVAQKVEALSP